MSQIRLEDYLAVFGEKGRGGFGALPGARLAPTFPGLPSPTFDRPPVTALAPPPRTASAPVLPEALLEELREDQKMWSLDASYRAKRFGKGLCSRRDFIAEWSPYGRCAYEWMQSGRRTLTVTDIECNHSIYDIEVPCTVQNLFSLAFQQPRYLWAQKKLRQLLERRPSGGFEPALADRWAKWCINVAELISLARWATNISDAYPGKLSPATTALYERTPYILPLEGPKTAAFWSRISQRRQDLGEYGQFRPVVPIAVRNWNQAPTAGWMRNETEEVVQAPPNLPLSRSYFAPELSTIWPMAWKDAVAFVESRFSRRSPVYTLPKPSSGLEVLTSLFKHSRSGQLLVETTWAPEDLGLRSSRNPGALRGTYLGGHGVVGLLTAMAEDAVLDRSYGDYVTHAFTLYINALKAIPDDIRNDLIGANKRGYEMVRVMAETAGSTERAIFSSVLGIIGGIATATGPVGAVIGGMIAAFVALLNLLHEIISAADGWATGAGAMLVCPPPPVIREIAGGSADCRWDDPDRDVLTNRELQEDINLWLGPGGILSEETPRATPRSFDPGGRLPRFEERRLGPGEEFRRLLETPGVRQELDRIARDVTVPPTAPVTVPPTAPVTVPPTAPEKSSGVSPLLLAGGVAGIGLLALLLRKEKKEEA